MVGVIGDTGGRTGDAERAERGECACELCDLEFGDVSTVRAGILCFRLLGGIVEGWLQVLRWRGPGSQ